MNNPLVSVVIPCYNQRPDFLFQCVMSALGQTYQNVEVIVSDNWSDTPAEAVLSPLADARLRVIRPARHLPMSEHFGFAGDSARGEYLSFLSSDDMVYPDWIESLLPGLLKDPQVVVGFGEIENVPFDNPAMVNYLYREKKMKSGVYAAKQVLPSLVFFKRTSGWMAADLIRTSAYRTAGGIWRDHLKYSCDYSLLLRLLEIGNLVYLNKTLGKIRAWGVSDGKVDACRISAAVTDMLKLYEIVDSSPVLSNALAKDPQLLCRARSQKSRIFAMLLLDAIGSGHVRDEDIPATRNNILAISGAPTTRLLLLLARKRLRAILGLLLPTAASIGRSRLGRKLLKL